MGEWNGWGTTAHKRYIASVNLKIFNFGDLPVDLEPDFLYYGTKFHQFLRWGKRRSPSQENYFHNNQG